MRVLKRAFLLGVIALLLSACSPFVDPDQVSLRPEKSVTLTPDYPVGQTFVARHAGLSGVEVWVDPEEGARGEIVLHLRPDPGSEEELATARLPLAQIERAGFHRFSFPPLREAHSRYYYAFLEMEGEGRVDVGAGSGAAYLDGALYRSHEPLDRQMGFRLAYDPGWLVLDLLWAVVRGVGLLAVAGLLYVVPGWALLAWLWPGRELPWAGRLGIAVGLSLALYPVLFLVTGLVGLRLGALYAWLPVVGGLAALVWRHRDWRWPPFRMRIGDWLRSESLWPDLSLMVVLALLFGVRLLVVRSLDAPMWGDSYQHTMIAQLLVDNGGLFSSWEPYAELETFTYHFGFHAAMAVFHWLTRMDMIDVVLWAAQILNGLAVLALYPLAVRVGKGRWAGVGAVLVAGLLSQMPMYYVNWGRYTQLAGQVILPVAAMLSWAALESERRDWRLLLLNWIAVGGLALTHYRVLIFYLFFVLAWAAIAVALSPASWRRIPGRLAILGGGAALLFLPWFVRVFGGKIVRIFNHHITTAPEQMSRFARSYNAIRDITFYLPNALWLLLPVAVVVGLWRNRRGVLLVSSWWSLLLLATNPSWLGLPGSGIVSNPALFMAAYVPVGILVGYLIGRLAAGLASWRWAGRVLIVCVVVGLGLFGALTRTQDLRVARHALVTRPDLRAVEWIRENTPQDARFLINSFFAYNDGAIVGSDAGWWLPLLAGRENTVPPLTYSFEQGPWADYQPWVNELTRQLQEEEMAGPRVPELLRGRGVTHIYIGQRQGRVNYNGPHILNPEAFLGDPAYRLIYHRDRVWIFEVLE